MEGRPTHRPSMSASMRACCPGRPFGRPASPAGVSVARRLPTANGAVWRRQSCPSLCSMIAFNRPRQPPHTVPAPVRRMRSSTVEAPWAAARRVADVVLVHPHTTSAPAETRIVASSTRNSPVAWKASICNGVSDWPRNNRPIASGSWLQSCGAATPSSWPDFSSSTRTDLPSGEVIVALASVIESTEPAIVSCCCGYCRTRTLAPRSSWCWETMQGVPPLVSR